MAATVETLLAAVVELLKKSEERSSGGGGVMAGRHRKEELDWRTLGEVERYAGERPVG